MWYLSITFLNLIDPEIQEDQIYTMVNLRNPFFIDLETNFFKCNIDRFWSRISGRQKLYNIHKLKTFVRNRKFTCSMKPGRTTFSLLNNFAHQKPKQIYCQKENALINIHISCGCGKFSLRCFFSEADALKERNGFSSIV